MALEARRGNDPDSWMFPSVIEWVHEHARTILLLIFLNWPTSRCLRHSRREGKSCGGHWNLGISHTSWLSCSFCSFFLVFPVGILQWSLFGLLGCMQYYYETFKIHLYCCYYLPLHSRFLAVTVANLYRSTWINLLVVRMSPIERRSTIRVNVGCTSDSNSVWNRVITSVNNHRSYTDAWSQYR